jgi:hypothetical protein
MKAAPFLNREAATPSISAAFWRKLHATVDLLICTAVDNQTTVSIQKSFNGHSW